MARAIIVSPDGIQHTQEIPTPNPFDFERDVLGDGPFDPKIAGALIELVMRDTFPEPSSPALFSWDKLSPNMVITIASSYHTLNEINMANAKVGEIHQVPDAKVQERISRRGVLTPNEIAQGKHLGPKRSLDAPTSSPSPTRGAAKI